ncbi:MAG: ATP-binding protein [Bacteroidota bacterium]
MQSRFTDLETVVAEVHPLLDAWGRDAAFAFTLGETRLHRIKLVIHEWIANLVQHADFEARTPLIDLSLTLNAQDVHCVIEDNSNGFDFGQQITVQRAKLEDEVMAERGRGLLIMLNGTDDLRYFPLPAAASEPRQRLEFWISATSTPCLDTPS